MSRLCLREVKCRGGTEVSVKIACEEENAWFWKKALMWRKEKRRRRKVGEKEEKRWTRSD